MQKLKVRCDLLLPLMDANQIDILAHLEDDIRLPQTSKVIFAGTCCFFSIYVQYAPLILFV